MSEPGKSTNTILVERIPFCDIDAAHGEAYADARIPATGGSWGYLCKACFDYFECSLGLGRGQRLVLRKGDDS
jgi:hypothetical protein